MSKFRDVKNKNQKKKHEKHFGRVNKSDDMLHCAHPPAPKRTTRHGIKNRKNNPPCHPSFSCAASRRARARVCGQRIPRICCTITIAYVYGPVAFELARELEGRKKVGEKKTCSEQKKASGPFVRERGVRAPPGSGRVRMLYDRVYVGVVGRREGVDKPILWRARSSAAALVRAKARGMVKTSTMRATSSSPIFILQCTQPALLSFGRASYYNTHSSIQN